MDKYDEQNTVIDYLFEKISKEFSTTGTSSTLNEILYEYCDKDDIAEIYSEAFEEE